MDIEIIKQFITPELMILIPVVYFFGIAAKKSEFVADKYIPIYLGLVSISLSLLWVFTTTSICINSFFTAVTQGALVAGASVYVNQIVKQINK